MGAGGMTWQTQITTGLLLTVQMIRFMMSVFWACRLYFVFYFMFFSQSYLHSWQMAINSASYCKPLRIQITFGKMSVKFTYTADVSCNKWYFAASRFKNRASCRTFLSLSCNWDNVLGLVDLPCVFVLSFCVKLAYLSVWAESRCLLVCKKTVHHQKVWKPDIPLDYQALTCG